MDAVGTASELSFLRLQHHGRSITAITVSCSFGIATLPNSIINITVLASNLLKLRTLNLKVYLHTEPKLVNKAVNINSETHVFWTKNIVIKPFRKDLRWYVNVKKHLEENITSAAGLEFYGNSSAKRKQNRPADGDVTSIFFRRPYFC